MKTLTVKQNNKKELPKFSKEIRAKIISSTTANEEEVYSPEFIASILQAREDSKNGKGEIIPLEDLWK